MGWFLLLITVAAFIFAIKNRLKTPKLSLAVALIVPFTAFYFIGKLEYAGVFIFASILYSFFHTLHLHREENNPQ